jgi:hypothetical protein
MSAAPRLERRPDLVNPLIAVSGRTSSFSVCRRCRKEIYSCADPRCERGGWYSFDRVGVPGSGRHECFETGGLELAPHIPG